MNNQNNKVLVFSLFFFISFLLPNIGQAARIDFATGTQYLPLPINIETTRVVQVNLEGELASRFRVETNFTSIAGASYPLEQSVVCVVSSLNPNVANAAFKDKYQGDFYFVLMAFAFQNDGLFSEPRTNLRFFVHKPIF